MFTPSLRMNFCGSPRAATGARGEPMTSAPPMEWVTEEVSDALGGIGFDTHHIRRPERGGECWHTTTAASRPDPAIFSTARPHYIQHDMGSDSTYSAAQKSAKNADCSAAMGRVCTSGRCVRRRSTRGRLRQARGICTACGVGHVGAKRARRLWVRDRTDLRLWFGTQPSFLLVAAPYFSQSRPVSHITRYAIT